jgi:hypothetical protein
MRYAEMLASTLRMAPLEIRFHPLRMFEAVPTRHIKPSLTGAPILINLTR